MGLGAGAGDDAEGAGRSGLADGPGRLSGDDEARGAERVGSRRLSSSSSLASFVGPLLGLGSALGAVADGVGATERRGSDATDGSPPPVAETSATVPTASMSITAQAAVMLIVRMRMRFPREDDRSTVDENRRPRL